MFAILISVENLPKIQEDQKRYPDSLAHFIAPPYLDSRVDWFYVSGVVPTTRNGDASWSCYPEEWFIRHFEFDIDKIKTDWDQIVEK